MQPLKDAFAAPPKLHFPGCISRGASSSSSSPVTGARPHADAASTKPTQPPHTALRPRSCAAAWPLRRTTARCSSSSSSTWRSTATWRPPRRCRSTSPRWGARRFHLADLRRFFVLLLLFKERTCAARTICDTPGLNMNGVPDVVVQPVTLSCGLVE